jgi:hypothetical protein
MLPIPPQVLIQIGAKVLPQLIGAGMSYAQAAKQKKEMKSAEDEAAKAIAAARAKLAEAPLERVQVPTEAYQNAMQQITAQSMQATQATQEAGARELAASVGRIGAMGLTATEQQRESMAQDIYKRDMAVAEDEGRRLELLARMDEIEARGAQLAEAQAAAQRGAALTSATTSLGKAIGTGIELSPLYKMDMKALQEMALRNQILNPNKEGGLMNPLAMAERQNIASSLGALQEQYDLLSGFGASDFVPLTGNK